MSFIFDELHAITTLYLVEVNECIVVLNDEHSEYKNKIEVIDLATFIGKLLFLI